MISELEHMNDAHNNALQRIGDAGPMQEMICDGAATQVGEGSNPGRSARSH